MNIDEIADEWKLISEILIEQFNWLSVVIIQRTNDLLLDQWLQ